MSVPGAPQKTSSAGFSTFARTRCVQAVGELRARRQPPGDEDDSRLAQEERRLARLRDVPVDVVRPLPEALEVPHREVGEVERRLGVPAPSERVESPEDARGADVELLHRARRVPAIPLVRAPQELRPAETCVGVGDDLADRPSHALLVPRRIGERVERLRPVQHRSSLGNRNAQRLDRASRDPSRDRSRSRRPRSVRLPSRSRSGRACPSACAGSRARPRRR